MQWSYYMKKIITLFLFIVFVLQTNVVYAIEAISVPRGTEVPIYFTSNNNSDKLYSGDIVSIKIAEDVYVNNKKVFAKGGSGYAEIEKAVRSGSHGRAGLIVINNAQVKDIQGKNHSVQLNIYEKGESRRASAITLSVLGVLLILVPFGIWREGDPAHVRSSKIFMAVTIND